MDNGKKRNAEVSVVLPCRNEETSLGDCIQQIKGVFTEHAIQGEIIVSDSSTDKSPDIARELGVVLVKHNKEGYGNAYLEGFKHAKGKYIFCADADGTYDFKEIPRFLEQLRGGHDFVIGNRFKGKIHKGAMPWSHRYIGNPALSFILRVFFRGKIHDVHCGMRALTRGVLQKLDLHATGMEFASEMIIQALKHNLSVRELSIDYYPRKGKSKLRTFSDGWRHLRFMLLYSPTFLFFYPGLLLFLVGIVSMLWFYIGTPFIFGVQLFFHPIFISSLFIFVGYQIMIFALFTKTYAMTHLEEKNTRLEHFYRFATLERGIVFAAILTFSGIGIFFSILYTWVQNGLGELQQVKNAIVALTFLILGIQTFFSSFMISILGIKQK